MCVCCHSSLSINTQTRVFPDRPNPPTDRMKEWVTGRTKREAASSCRNVSKTKKKKEDKYRSGQAVHGLKIEMIYNKADERGKKK